MLRATNDRDGRARGTTVGGGPWRLLWSTTGSLGQFVAGFLAGLTVGFGVALLLAPQEGSEARQQLQAHADAVRERPKQVMDDMQARLQQAVEEGKQAAEEARAQLEASAGVELDRDTGLSGI